MAEYNVFESSTSPLSGPYLMPIFEFACKQCGHGFETLVGPNRAARCPRCEAEELERRLSVFAVGRGGGTPRASAPGPCGTCGDPRGPGSCRLD